MKRRFKSYGQKTTASLENHSELQQENLTPEERMQDELNRLEHAAQTMVSVEGFFSSNGARILMKLQDGFTSLTTWNFPILEDLSPNLMQHVVSDLKYTDLIDDQVAQPPGLKVTMLEYIKALDKATDVPMAVISDVLEPAQRRFGHYLTVPDERGDKRDYVHGAMVGADAEDLFRQSLSKVLTPDNVQATAAFGDLFTSLNQFIECERAMAPLIAKATKANPKAVKAAVERMETTAGSLVGRLARSDNGASNAFIEMVAKELKTVAQSVSFYSAAITKIIELNNLLALTEKYLRQKAE